MGGGVVGVPFTTLDSKTMKLRHGEVDNTTWTISRKAFKKQKRRFCRKSSSCWETTVSVTMEANANQEFYMRLIRSLRRLLAEIISSTQRSNHNSPGFHLVLILRDYERNIHGFPGEDFVCTFSVIILEKARCPSTYCQLGPWPF